MNSRFKILFCVITLLLTLYVGLLQWDGANVLAFQSTFVAPPGFEDVSVVKITSPTGIDWTPDGRMLIAKKGGELYVFENGTLVSPPAIDLPNTAICTNGERGLGDVEVHPDYESNHYIFLYYTYNKYNSCDDTGPNAPVNRLSRFVLSHNNVIDPASETVFFDTPQLYTDHHNGGDIEFGKDGNIYVTIGDGDGAPFGWPGDPGILMGKIVRLTAEGGIPADNPYTGADSVRCNVDGVPPTGSPPGAKCKEVLSVGFRNPFRFAFDPNAPSTRFFVNDVGSNTWEDISEGPTPGGHYGWNAMEGPCKTHSETVCTPNADYVDPVHWYSHGGHGAAVTGGAFVPNGVWPSEYDGSYLYARFVQSKIHRITPGANGCRSCLPPTSNYIDTEFATAPRIVDMKFGPHNNTQALYYTNRETNEVRRIAYVGSSNRSPVAVADASTNSGPVPLVVHFDGISSNDPDGDSLTYEWDFNGDGIVDATGETTSYTFTTVATYNVTLTVRDGNGGENSTSLMIDAGNTPPEVTIELPAPDARFAEGQKLVLHGSATDLQDGELSDSALTWEVRRHHNTHYHPYLDPSSGNDLEIIAPGPEDLVAATNSYLEVLLTAIDSNGLSTTVSRNILPLSVTLTMNSDPSGLVVIVDEVELITPVEFVTWQGHRLRVNAPDQQGSQGNDWQWESWSNGGAQQHFLAAPDADAVYTVTFGTAATSTPVPSATVTSTPVPSTATSTSTPSSTSTPLSPSATPGVTPTHSNGPVTISGTVYHDRNANGAKDANEEGISNVLLSLSNGQAAFTNSSGAYSFTVLAGEYTLTETDPIGYTSTGDAIGANDNQISVTVKGFPIENLNFYDVRLALIQGRIVDDQDGNGQHDQNEPGLAGVRVTLSDGQETTTDSSGFYSFTVLPGEYTVTVSNPAGYSASGDPQGSSDSRIVVVVGAGQTTSDLTFLEKLEHGSTIHMPLLFR